MMMNDIDEEPAVASFNYYKAFLTGDSTDPELKRELLAMIQKYTKDEGEHENEDVD